MTSRPELKVLSSPTPRIERHFNSFQVDDEGGFIKFFKSLPDNGEDTVRIFDRGDFYTAHGDNASFIARTVTQFFLQIWHH
jgi:hypothetical protein